MHGTVSSWNHYQSHIQRKVSIIYLHEHSETFMLITRFRFVILLVDFVALLGILHMAGLCSIWWCGFALHGRVFLLFLLLSLLCVFGVVLTRRVGVLVRVGMKSMFLYLHCPVNQLGTHVHI